MLLMGLEARYFQAERPLLPTESIVVYPYLLRGVKVTRPNQVWKRRHHLHSDEYWFHVFGSRDRLV